MALIIVNSLSDGAVNHADDATNLTLRDAIALAEAQPGTDEIVFASNLTGNITLASGALEIIAGNDLSINGDTNGDGNPDIMLVGSGSNHIRNDAAVSLQSLGFAGGSIENAFNAGGSITNYSGGSLSIAYCDFTGNSATAADDGFPGYIVAGAIFNDGTLNITQSTLTNGYARGGSGTNSADENGYSGGAAASGIINRGTLTISHTVIEAGSARGGDGGMAGTQPPLFNGYNGGDGGYAVHGILNLGTITAGSGVENRNAGTFTGGAGGEGGAGAPGFPNGNTGATGGTTTGNSGNLTNLSSEANNGTSGNDTESFGDFASFYGLNGNDIITAGYGSTIHGGAGNDTIINTTVSGGSFNGGIGTDTLDVSADSFDGYTFDLSAPSFSMYGATFSDFENVIATQGNDIIIGADGIINSMSGSGGNDTITGRDGDIVDGGAGNDTIINTYVNGGTWDGGDDVDTLDLSQDAFDGYTFNLGAASFEVLGGTFSNFENLIGTGGGDIIFGSSGINILDGHTGDDIIRGGAGGDTLIGGNNGLGGDTVDYTGATGGVTVNLHLQTATGSHATGDTLSGFENATGGSSTDTIVGSVDANVLNGGAGVSDTVSYTHSNALVIVNLATGAVSGGHAEGDTISNFERVTGSDFGDTLRGSDIANLLTGGDGEDSLFGEAGSDTIIGGVGGDTLDGGSNTAIGDTLDYSASLGGVLIDLGNNTANGGDATDDSITGFENVIGSVEADTLEGGTGKNSLYGVQGADTLVMNFIFGDTAGELLDGGSGTDTLVLKGMTTGVTAVGHNLRDDTIVSIERLNIVDVGADATRNILLNASQFGGTGFATDTVISFNPASEGSAVIDIAMGSVSTFSAASLTFTGDTSSARVLITGDADAEAITGSAINDTIRGGAGGDNMNGGGGTGDTVDYSDATGGVTVNLHLQTATGSHATGDTLSGFENATGGGSTDTIVGSVLANVLNGGAGVSDTVSYTHSNALVNVNLATGAVSGGHAAGDTILNFERVTGSAFADTLRGNDIANRLTGGDGADSLFGEAGSDTLLGGVGDDKLYAGAGSDVVDGGADFDLASYFSEVAGAIINLAQQSANAGSALGDTFTSIERFNGSNTGGDTLRGNGDGNHFEGYGGTDSLFGEGGADILKGGAGDDKLYAGAGSDIVDGGADFDLASYFAETAGAVINFNTQSLNAGSAVGDTLVSIERINGSNTGGDTLRGDGSSNTFFGFGGVDALFGDAGIDTLNGGAGDDSLYGGAGGDAMDGGADFDTASYYSEVAGATINLANQALNAGSALGDTLINIERINGSNTGADNLTGDDNANYLVGYGGIDTLLGGNGDDTLRGGVGADILSGNAGADKFRYDAVNEGGDSISTVSSLDDFQFVRTAFGNLAGANVAAINFLSRASGNTATTTDHRFIFDQATDTLWFDSNGTGAGGLTMIADIGANTTLTHLDLLLV
jgi:Ca2+-binding RTX toxin-like protein